MHHTHTGQAPQYLSDCVSTVSALSGRYRLRSTGSADDYVLPRTITRFGERGFSYCGLKHFSFRPTWHYWHRYIQKTTQEWLFDRAYHWLLLALLDVSYSGALQISRWFLIPIQSVCVLLVWFATTLLSYSWYIVGGWYKQSSGFIYFIAQGRPQVIRR